MPRSLIWVVLLLACGDATPPGTDATPAALAAAPTRGAVHAAQAPAAAPPAARDWAPPAPSASGRPSVLLLGIDGAEWKVVDPLLAHGWLPNLGRLVAEGARAQLDCTPAMPETACFCPPVWVSIATGVPYRGHGIATLHQEAGDRKAAALWEVLHAAGGSTTLVSFRNTWPPEASARYVLTEYGLDWAAGETYELLPKEPPQARPARAESRTRPVDLFEQLVLPTHESGKPPVLRSVGRDRVAMQALLRLAARDRTDLTVVLLHSPDKAQHLGWAALQPAPEDPLDEAAVLAQASEWQRPPPPPARTPGPTAVSQYLEVDAWLGDLLASVAYDYVLVASDHGMTRNPEPTGLPGEHGPRLPDAHRGVWILWGPGVRRGVALEGVDVFDVAPTLAHVMGLPVAEDLPGRVIEEAFEEAWWRAHPVATVARWVPSREPKRRRRRRPGSGPSPSPSGG